MSDDDSLLAELDLAAGDLEDPSKDLCETSENTSLKDWLDLVEQNPGLKITLSF